MTSARGARAPTSTELTPDQVRRIRACFARLNANAEQVAALFYLRLFELEPGARGMFKRDLTAQGRKLMAAIAALVRGLDDFDAVRALLVDLGRRHRAYGVEGRHYDAVGRALIWTLEQGLGEDFGEAERDAWRSLYAQVAHVMGQAPAPAAAPSPAPPLAPSPVGAGWAHSSGPRALSQESP